MIKILLVFGCPGWDRTNEWRIQSPLPYRLATGQYLRTEDQEYKILNFRSAY